MCVVLIPPASAFTFPKQYGRYFKSRDARFAYEAVDGALNVASFTSGFVQWADLTLPLHTARGAPADWVLCLEVGEHLPAQYEEGFLDNVDAHNRCGAILSWAVEGQAGKGHVNMHNNDYVINAMTKRGYTYDAATSMAGRDVAELPWMKNTFMLFTRPCVPLAAAEEEQL
jgi:hypothetical protein